MTLSSDPRNPPAPDASLLEAAKTGSLSSLLSLLQAPLDSSWSLPRAMSIAAAFDHPACVEALLPLCPRLVDRSQALIEAARHGSSNCVRLLIPVSDPKYFASLALNLAAFRGYPECLQLLIPVSDPKADHSSALRESLRFRISACAELLIPVSDPKAINSEALELAAVCPPALLARLIPLCDPLANDSAALIAAAKSGNAENLSLLIPVSDPSAQDFRALRSACSVQPTPWKPIPQGYEDCALLLIAAAPPPIELARELEATTRSSLPVVADALFSYIEAFELSASTVSPKPPASDQATQRRPRPSI